MRATHRLQRFACHVGVMAVGVCVAASASAQTVLLDFGTNLSFRGVSTVSPDANGHYWNNIVPGNYIPDMRDINNVTTTIDLGPDTPVATDSYNGPAGATDMGTPASNVPNTDIDTVALGNLGVLTAGFDFAASPGNDSEPLLSNRTRFQLQGLDPAAKYTLTFFGSHKYNADAATVYSVFNDDAYSNLLDSASLNVHDPVDFSAHNRNQVAVIGNLSPAANGILYVQFVGANNYNGYLNSMQITGTAIPEPASLLLLLCGVTMVFGIRRR